MTRAKAVFFPSRRRLLKSGVGSSDSLGLRPAVTSPWSQSGTYAKGTEQGPEISLAMRRETLQVAGKPAHPISMDGTSPGPLFRLKEGRDAFLKVTNLLYETTSIHWHGIILPPGIDGVPGVSFAGLCPRETFTYRFPVRQHSTCRHHSHSGLQVQLSHADPMIIDAAERELYMRSFDGKKFREVIAPTHFATDEHLLAESIRRYYRSNSCRRWDNRGHRRCGRYSADALAMGGISP
ncbi:multicopper oxidase domain-containing protein [Halomonas sp. MA07-2]|uniref:multicopper oxidase domain-containing protein n=1 Tax=Halomonas sp. MA07-2 TaxID=3440841 RepID=UPI003EEBD508